MENNGKNSVFPLVIISLVIALLVAGAYWFGKSSINSKVQEENLKIEEDTSKKTTTSLLVEKSKTEIKESETSPDEKVADEESDEDVVEILKLLFAQKYERNVEDAVVTISQREGDYLVGGIKFTGDISGGYVLAAKVNGIWKIVFDGNGNVVCKSVDEVDFPASLVSECWDEEKMDVRYRVDNTEDR